jgi:hypothetical protein
MGRCDEHAQGHRHPRFNAANGAGMKWTDIDRLSQAELIDLNHRIVKRFRFLAQIHAHARMTTFRIGGQLCLRAGEPHSALQEPSSESAAKGKRQMHGWLSLCSEHWSYNTSTLSVNLFSSATPRAPDKEVWHGDLPLPGAHGAAIGWTECGADGRVALGDAAL